MKELLIKRGYLPVFIAGAVMVFVGAGGTYFLRNLIHFLMVLLVQVVCPGWIALCILETILRRRKKIMKVYELIELLKEMPQFNVVKLNDEEYVNDVEEVELDDRDYIIIRPR
ncbi:hypothetical protein LG291_26805 (plasmid) [Cytobacillus firmus]|uniref:Uncharacterized protein n=1 Tax=Cytobacillus firmus DS1 TaxID=1307436 RepID=W7KZ65_CYTFI|nr:hypothetical protein [Cytobacillus firmus]EWG08601.1 hypothetical protein PBF_23448 [Cytobacillus firmus DS1]